MKMFNQSEILNKAFRLKVIQDINSGENEKRKREAEKRQDCYRDNTIKWVIKYLQDLNLKDQTLAVMQKHASNISVLKKIVNKKAKSYRGSVLRSTDDEATTAQVMALAALMGLNDHLKKADAYSVLQNNALLMVLPDQTPENKICLRPSVLGPWQFDVIEDARNPERPAALILSDWEDPNGTSSYNSQQIQGIDQAVTTISDSTIAVGSMTTQNSTRKTYIWWTDLYHFTTDETGEIIRHLSPEDLSNPIGMIPGVTISQNQDGKFWGSGGEDLTDGAILVNLMCTDMNAILYIQGWGQLVISGENIPEKFEVGPHSALVLQAKPGGTPAQASLLAHSPPIDSWLKVIEQYVAMLLTTNDLSVGSVSMTLNAQNFASGIAMLIDKSEVTGSIDDRRQGFATAERRLWKVVGKWTQLYGQADQLDHEFKEIGPLPEDIETSVRFQGEEQITTEKEKLEILKMRKELGLASQLDLIKADNPHMTDEEAQAKMEEIATAAAESMVKDATETVDKMMASEDQSSDSEDMESAPETEDVNAAE